jgi:glycosyltransferase involved in cell wall biosynthesis
VFSIAWQHSKEDLWDNLDKYASDPRFKIIPIDYKESKGACWSRNLLQQQYDGEEWTLQIDSHMRFEKDWDQTLVEMWYQLYTSGVKKPLITTYLPSFKPETDPKGRATVPYRMASPHFTPEGVVLFKSAFVHLWNDLEVPQPTHFYSAHFAFAKGDFVKEVPHDPELYFHGEEISIAARAYTWGYGMYYPHILVAYHEYTRQGRTKVWDDNKEWWKADHLSKLRFNYLMGQKKPPQPIEWGPYGFGPYRTLADYEAATGIDFKKRIIRPYK